MVDFDAPIFDDDHGVSACRTNHIPTLLNHSKPCSGFKQPVAVKPAVALYHMFLTHFEADVIMASMQRLRVRFGRGEEVKFISHLDIMRFWERAFRRARIPLAYSEGFTPHPRISLAAPLPVGVTSVAELMDVVLNGWMSPQVFVSNVTGQLTPGFAILDVTLVSPTLPSLQAQVRQAEYRVGLAGGKSKEEVESAIHDLLSRETIPWHHKRDTGEKSYDLRPLVDDLWLVEWNDVSGTIGMRLRCGNLGSGRPEQVAAALGFTGHPQAVERCKLVLEVS
jgi:radical SAM-linked protein